MSGVKFGVEKYHNVECRGGDDAYGPKPHFAAYFEYDVEETWQRSEEFEPVVNKPFSHGVVVL